MLLSAYAGASRSSQAGTYYQLLGAPFSEDDAWVTAKSCMTCGAPGGTRTPNQTVMSGPL